MLFRESIACEVTESDATTPGNRERIMVPGPHSERAKAAQPTIAQEPSAATLTRGSSGGDVVQPSTRILPVLPSKTYKTCVPVVPPPTPQIWTRSEASVSAVCVICPGNVP